MRSWWVYVLVNGAGHTYVGIALDPESRLLEHNGIHKGGAKRTRSGRPWRIGNVYGPYPNRSTACKVEYQIKTLRGPSRLNYSLI